MTYSDNNFQFIENTKEFPINPGTHRVYGKTVKKFRQRPTADAKFTHAQLLIPGQVKPVNLVGLNGRLRNAIENDELDKPDNRTSSQKIRISDPGRQVLTLWGFLNREIVEKSSCKQEFYRMYIFSLADAAFVVKLLYSDLLNL